jgi:hypothetical protein
VVPKIEHFAGVKTDRFDVLPSGPFDLTPRVIALTPWSSSERDASPPRGRDVSPRTPRGATHGPPLPLAATRPMTSPRTPPTPRSEGRADTSPRIAAALRRDVQTASDSPRMRLVATAREHLRSAPAGLSGGGVQNPPPAAMSLSRGEPAEARLRRLLGEILSARVGVEEVAALREVPNVVFDSPKVRAMRRRMAAEGLEAKVEGRKRGAVGAVEVPLELHYRLMKVGGGGGGG